MSHIHSVSFKSCRPLQIGAKTSYNHAFTSTRNKPRHRGLLAARQIGHGLTAELTTTMLTASDGFQQPSWQHLCVLCSAGARVRSLEQFACKQLGIVCWTRHGIWLSLFSLEFSHYQLDIKLFRERIFT